jgi:hypothetical protein
MYKNSTPKKKCLQGKAILAILFPVRSELIYMAIMRIYLGDKTTITIQQK